MLKYNYLMKIKYKGGTFLATKYKVGSGCAICLMCIYRCPVNAISVIENVSAYIDPEKCIGCGKCYNNCQPEAIIKVEE